MRSGTAERDRDPAPPSPEPAPGAAATEGREPPRGRLVLSSRFSGPVRGTHRVQVSAGTTGMRCTVGLELQRGGKTALLVSDRGELLALDGNGVTPIACSD